MHQSLHHISERQRGELIISSIELKKAVKEEQILFDRTDSILHVLKFFSELIPSFNNRDNLSKNSS